MDFFNRLFIVIIFGVLLNRCLTIKFIVRPNNMTVNTGANVSLRCTADPDPIYYIWQYQKIDRSSETMPKHLGFCFKGKPCRINEWQSQIQISNSSLLIIYNISSLNTGRYICETSSSTESEPVWSSAIITVKTPPKSISIHFNRSKNAFKENEYIAIQCSVQGGIPAPKIFLSVIKNTYSYSLNVSIDNSQQLTSGEVSATSLWRPHYLQHQGFIKCFAVNDAGNLTTRSAPLNIIFEPKIKHFSPSRIMAVANETLDLSCDVMANPSAKVRWIIRNGAQQIDSSDLYTKVRSDMAGELTCKAKNSIGSRSESLLLVVLRDPKIEISETYRIRENSDHSITCTVDSVPSPDFVKWFKLSNNSNHLTVLISNDAKLNFIRTDRSSSGMYACVTQNTQIPTKGEKRIVSSEKIMNLIVTYKPGEPRIINDESITVLKGAPFVLNCSFNQKNPGEPLPLLTWIDIESRDTISNFPTFEIKRSESRHSGQFQCLAKNEIGSTLSSEIVTVTVNEPPSLIPQNSNTKIFLSYADLPQSVAFNCTFRGKPLQNFNWRYANKIITSSSQDYKIEVQKNISNDKSTIIFTRLTVYIYSSLFSEQTSVLSFPNGRYSCEVNNAHGNASFDYFLIIKYPPVIRVDLRKRKIAALLNQDNVSVQCTVESISAIHMDWFKTSDNKNVIRESQKYLIKTEDIFKYDADNNLFTPGEKTSILIIKNVEIYDFTNYSCVARNEQGISKMNFEVVFKSQPDSPYDLKVLNIEWDSVTISWKSGFNGGQEQTFEIQVTSNLFGSQNVPFYSDKDENTLTITGLHPSTQYEIKIFAINSIGRSVSSETVKYVTKRIHKFDKIRAEILQDQPKIAVIVPESDLCANLEYSRDNGRQWFSILHCVRFNGSHINETVLLDITRVTSVLDLQSGLILLRLTFCLLSRPGVCSLPRVLENPKNDNFATQTIILVIAVICFLLIIILITLFIVCCIRFRYHCALCNQQYCCDCCFPRCYSSANKGNRYYNSRKNYENKPLSCCEENLDEMDLNTGSTSNYCSSLIGSTTPRVLNKICHQMSPHEVYSSFICPHNEFRQPIPILYEGSSFLQPAVLPWPQKVSPPSCEASSSHSHSSTGSSGRNLPQNPIHYRKKQDGISNNNIFNLKSYAQIEEKIKLPDVTSEAIHFVKASNDEKVMEAVV